jgi:hypothetical protein
LKNTPSPGKETTLVRARRAMIERGWNRLRGIDLAPK